MLCIHTDTTIVKYSGRVAEGIRGNSRERSSSEFIPLLEHHIPELMICEILSFIDEDIADVYCKLMTLNKEIPNKHRHVIVHRIINTVFTRRYDPDTHYKIVCSLNDLQEIAYLRKLIRLLFIKIDQLDPGEPGITCNIKHYLSRICTIGLYIPAPHCIYHIAQGEKIQLMSSVHYENIAIAFLMEGFTYKWIPSGIENEKPAPYFRFIGKKRMPTHCDCRRFRRENGIV